MSFFAALAARPAEPLSARGAASFGLATVADRARVPFALIPLWAIGELPGSVAWSFARLDPALAAGAHAVWRRSA